MGVEAAVDAAEHDHLGRRLGDVDLELEEESIELRLGKRVGPLVFHRVLRGHHEKSIAQRAALAVGGDLALLHRLEQRRLRLGGCAVDLVGEQRVGEDRPLAELEGAAVGPVDARADDVGGQQVGRELNAREARVERGCQRPRHQRLRGAGHAFEEHMAAAEDRDVQPVDDLQLADNGSSHGLVQGRAQRRRVALGLPLGALCPAALKSIIQPARPSIAVRTHRRRARGRRSSLSSGRPGRKRASMREQRGERRGRLRVAGHGDRGAERRVVEMPVDAGRAADPSFELVGVARRDRSSLTAAREQLPHRGHVCGRARHRGRTAVLRGLAETPAVERDRQEHHQPTSSVASPTGPSKMAPAPLVPVPSPWWYSSKLIRPPRARWSRLSARNEESPWRRPSLESGCRVPEDVRASARPDAHHPCDDLTVLDEHRNERRLVGEASGPPRPAPICTRSVLSNGCATVATPAPCVTGRVHAELAEQRCGVGKAGRA